MKKVLITGGNKGIGLETTKMFYKMDCEIFIVARDFKDFKISDNDIYKVEFDLRKVDKINEIYDEVGSIDVLVNNAGIMNSLPYDAYPKDKQEDLLNINLYSPIELIKMFSKDMIKKGEGRIVNIASIAGHIGHPDIWYGISKAALINVTKSFAKLLGPKGIIINCVAPGPVDTGMLSVIPDHRKKELKASSILKRFAKPQEIAKAVYWLGTESPENINGICIDANNGAFMR